MKGKINKNGELFIERKGVMLQVYCMQNGGDYCSHHCVGFGEPDDPSLGNLNTGTLRVCQNRTLYFDTFTDER